MTARNPRLTRVSSEVPPTDSEDSASAGLLTSLVQLLDGSNSWEQIWGKLLVAEFEPKAIASALARLQREGVLDQGAAAYLQDPAVARQADLLGLLAAQQGVVADTPSAVGREMQALLGSCEVAVFASSMELGDEIHRLIGQVGISRISGSTDAGEPQVRNAAARLRLAEHAVVVCATQGAGRELADLVNRVCVDSGVAAVYYHAQGLQMQLGPLVIPGQTSCLACYQVRRNAALAPWERSLLATARDAGQLACVLGADWLTVDVVKFLTRLGEPVSRGRVLFIDYFAGLPEVHSVLRLPRCKVCGAPRRPAVRLWDEPSGQGK
jgi:bacteriocin biosynthesis cyclodehydratase domain-containing protein